MPKPASRELPQYSRALESGEILCPGQCAYPVYIPCSSTRQLPSPPSKTHRQLGTMSCCTRARQRRLRCDHLYIGIIRWPHQSPGNPRMPAASVYCRRAECIRDAAAFIHECTGHRETYQQFPENASLTMRHAQLLANDPLPWTRSAYFHATGTQDPRIGR